MTEAIRELPVGWNDRVRNWSEVLSRGNLAEGRPLDAVSRWLLITRASVLPMTLTSGLIGGLFAVEIGAPRLDLFVLCLLGLICAHLTNNLMNDYFDLEGGVDTEEYPRALYAPHPVLSGWLTRRQLFATIAATNLLGAAILLALTAARGWPVLAFGAAGFVLSFFYVAPPLALKHRGLGEPSVFVVWGPLMIGGTTYVTAGSLPSWVWLASIPYAILVSTVLIGKHIDKLPYDAPKNVRTLPVLLGEPVAIVLNQALMVSFFVLVFGLVVLGIYGPWTLLVLLALPRLVQVAKIHSDPKPASPPKGYPIWPLWYVAAAFVLTRRAGGLLLIGLVLDRLLPLH